MNNWKTYTVFISSTFVDMQAERDYLNMVVFPQVNNMLRDISVSLRVIDLRWGINTSVGENSIEQKVIEVCLDEIDRSRPFFIGLLGNKYGWIPESRQLNDQEVLTERQSITSLEVEYGFLNNVDKLGGYVFMNRSQQSYNGIPEEYMAKYDDNYSDLSELEKSDRIQRLKRLKNRIKHTLIEQGKETSFIEYNARWEGDSFTDLEQFGSQLRDALVAQIIDSHRDNNNSSPFFNIQNIQNEFISLYLSKKSYCRDDLINYIQCLVSEPSGAVALSGESGTGKSSIFSFIVKHFQANNDYLVLYHTTALGQYSHSLNYLLQKWVYEMEEHLTLDHIEIQNIKECELYFNHLLKQTVKHKDIVICVDAIDGFIDSNASKYLTFFPRARLDRLHLFVSGLPLNCQTLCRFNKKVQLIEMPKLKRYEAVEIVNLYFAYYRKERNAYECIIDPLLAKKDNNTGCYYYESPLWMTLALHILMSITKVDYEKFYKTNSYDGSLQTYFETTIDKFERDEYELFIRLLSKLDDFFNDLPTLLFLTLSVSYNGLTESVLRHIAGEAWSSIDFAHVINYMNKYLSEVGDEKIWTITHNKIKIKVSNEVRKDICAKISHYYLDIINNGGTVNDNILYYLYYGECYDESFEYCIKNRKNKNRLNNEFCSLAGLIDIELLFNFISNIFHHQGYISKMLCGNIVKLNVMKNIIQMITNKWLYEGDYEKAIKLIELYQQLLAKTKTNKGFKSLMYILVNTIRVDAMNNIGDNDMLRKAYQEGLENLHIADPISLILVPICRKYYKWNLIKLNN